MRCRDRVDRRNVDRARVDGHACRRAGAACETPAAVTEIRRLLDDRPARGTQAARGLEAYRSQFAMELTVARLRAATALTVPA